jgi:hypothetical protein
MPRQGEMESMGGKYGEAPEIRDETAQFIVRACNSHEALLNACRMLLNCQAGSSISEIDKDGMEALDACIEAARLAVAKATKGGDA